MAEGRRGGRGKIMVGQLGPLRRRAGRGARVSTRETSWWMGRRLANEQAGRHRGQCRYHEEGGSLDLRYTPTGSAVFGAVISFWESGEKMTQTTQKTPPIAATQRVVRTPIKDPRMLAVTAPSGRTP